ncbi:MAG: ATP-dependent nuclease [Armatimonadota bacterium]
MELSSISIGNFRSLVDVHLDNLQQHNIIIGRNNSGKSTVFRAISTLAAVGRGAANLDRVPTMLQQNRVVEIKLRFNLSRKQRREFLSLFRGESRPGDIEELLSSPFLSSYEIRWRSRPHNAGDLNCDLTAVIAADGGWANILYQEESGNLRYYEFERMFKEHYIPTAANISSSFPGFSATTTFPRNFIAEKPRLTKSTRCWFLLQAAEWLSKCYFFDPIRRCTGRMNSTAAQALDPNGGNLAQFLFTLFLNRHDKFKEIQEFFRSALSGDLDLSTPIDGSTTHIQVHSRGLGVGFWLEELGGGGVEQLLMVAAVLATMTDDHPLFIEEPESHLHPGAQRFLMERLASGGRQVFITTHSPTIVNSPQAHSLYQTQLEDGLTSVRRVDSAERVSPLLTDIGVRNSDLFLSDAAVFVEGPGEASVLPILGRAVGLDLEEQNISVLVMGGGFAPHAKIRSEVLHQVSARAPIPHLIVLDRDERSRTEIASLARTHEETIHVLARRELENYLLVPRAIRSALLRKHAGDTSIVENIESSTDEDVEDLIETAISELRDQVLVKRLRAEVGGLVGGLLPRESARDLVSSSNPETLGRDAEEKIRNHVEGAITGLRLEALVKDLQEELVDAWADPERRRELAPGEEVLQRVFQHFGSNYRKPKDTVHIAEHLGADDIAPELQELVRRIGALIEPS